MRKEDTATLNQHALAQRLREQGLKQWLVARQIGVTKLTVNRWLTGRVRRISRDNLAKLAEVLGCEEAEIVYTDVLDVHATQQEQAAAVRTLVSAQSQQLFMASGKHDIYEQLAKAVIHPNLPLTDLMTIYSTLTSAAYEQGKFAETRTYAELYLDYALRCGDAKAELSARSGIAASDGALGKLRDAAASLSDLVGAAESSGQTAGIGVALLNLFHAWRLLGELARAMEVGAWLNDYLAGGGRQRLRAVRSSHYATMALELGYFELARRQLELQRELAGEFFTPQERLSAVMLVQLCHSLEVDDTAPPGFAAELDEFMALPIRPEGGIVWPAAVLRCSGDVDGAERLLHGAAEDGRLRIYDPPFVAEELARCALARGDQGRAMELQVQANAGYAGFGMDKRQHDGPPLELGSQFRRPPRARKVLAADMAAPTD